MASSAVRHLSVTLEQQKELEKLSPFELKDKLIQLAGEASRQSAQTMLNAGRGNPNWIATTPRNAFFALGSFAVEESKRVWDQPDLGGMPQKDGISKRLKDFLAKNLNAPGASMLGAAVDYAVREFKFNPDGFVHELVDGIIGDQYPFPDRILIHTERVAQEYLAKEMCAGEGPATRFDIFAVEGGTAAMCYIFDSLVVNGLLHKGDKVGLAVPTFTPYIEICHLHPFTFNVVEINADEVSPGDSRHTWQYPDSEIDKLADPSIKALFFVNPSNPPSVAMRPTSMKRLASLIQNKRPDLIVITDDVYGTFVPGFQSLMAEVPQNTIGVYSFSKYFGCTGWRLGVVAIHQDNIFDEMIAKLPDQHLKALDKRYAPIVLEPRKFKFIDRIVADSRDIGLNHTAGLSLPQQVMMSMFSLAELMDASKRYQKASMEILPRRARAMIEGLGIEVSPNPLYDAYYGL